MEIYKYLPTKEGGFVRKEYNKLTANEKLFVAKTAHCVNHTESEKLYYQRLAKELIFIQ